MNTSDRPLTAPPEAPGIFETVEPSSVPSPVPFGLTPRELEVAKLIARGLDGHEIAKALDFALKTYDTHRHNILKKSGCKNAVQLTHQMIRRGLADLDVEIEP